MNIKYRIGSTFLSLLALLSCNDEERNIETKGYLELGVTKNVEVITRGFDVDDQSLAVDVCVGANDSVAKHFDDYNSMAGERVLLDVGTYKVKVSSNPIQKLDFEMPTFYGEEKNVAVTAGKTTPVSVECFLSCVKITTEFTKPVKEKFASCVARISDKSGVYLDYSMTETRAGYFQPDYIMVDLTVENKEGLTFKMSKLIENTEARDHYHLIFDLVESGDNNSGMDFNISVETDPTNDEKHNVTIPLPETGYGQGAPEVQFVGANDEVITTLTFDKGDSQTLMAKVSSENIGLNTVTLLTTSSLFEEKELPTSLNLLNLSEEDKTKLSAIGLTIPTLENNKKPFDINFSTMVSTYLPGGTHTFTIVARDEMGHEYEQTVTAMVRSVLETQLVESEIWSHHATLRGYVKGVNPDNVVNYKFQYRKGNNLEWVDFEGSVTVGNNGSSNVTQVVTGLESGETYEYRIVADGTPADITKTFTTEEARQMPNSNFEEWCYEGNLPRPWAQGGTSFWNNGNSSIDIVFTTINAIMTEPDKTNVVEGSTTSTYMKSSWQTIKLAAGNIFTGNFKLDGTNGVLTLGRDFSSRPSVFKGHYKYIPSNVTSGKGDGQYLSAGDPDLCSIYIALATEQITIHTGSGPYFDKDNPAIIAYGSLSAEEEKGTNGEFKDFSIPLVYKDLARTPKYIIVVASSSKYGDYFEGGEGSQMWLDDVSLEYPTSIDEIQIQE